MNNSASITATITAFTRAYHAEHGNPIIFNDSLARILISNEEYSFLGKTLAEGAGFYDPEGAASCKTQAELLACFMRTQTAPITRARYTEDHLKRAVEQGIQQYVILGAGMDTFAHRNPWQHLQVFEIDHPATQAAKQQRLTELGWESPNNLHYLPLDFSSGKLTSSLQESSYDPKKPSFFSWLGVSMYLSLDDVMGTWRSISALCSKGSRLVFDYFDTDAFDPEKATYRMKRLQHIVKQTGEPFLSGLEPAKLPEMLAKHGMRLIEDLSPSEITARYFGDNTQSLYTHDHLHLAYVEVI